MNKKLPDNVFISNMPLHNIYLNTKIVISCGPTSATIESLAHGLNLLVPILDINDSLISKMLKVDKKIIANVENEENLISLLKKIEHKKNMILKKEKVISLKNYLFNKSTKQNMRLFN